MSKYLFVISRTGLAVNSYFHMLLQNSIGVQNVCFCNSILAECLSFRTGLLSAPADRVSPHYCLGSQRVNMFVFFVSRVFSFWSVCELKLNCIAYILRKQSIFVQQLKGSKSRVVFVVFLILRVLLSLQSIYEFNIKQGISIMLFRMGQSWLQG